MTLLPQRISRRLNSYLASSISSSVVNLLTLKRIEESASVHLGLWRLGRGTVPVCQKYRRHRWTRQVGVGLSAALVRQCGLLGISRSSLYYLPTEAGAEDLELMALIDQQYLKTPFYGSRRMTAWLRNHGHQVNRKRVRRLMQLIGL